MERYRSVVQYIEENWQQSLQAKPKQWGNVRNIFMHIARIKLPFPSIPPNYEYFAGTQFYWDSYFTILGLVHHGRADIAKTMVDNLVYLFPKFGLVPARNSWTSLGRTQPPFLTQMAKEVYEAKAADRQWYDAVMRVAQAEYESVWMQPQRQESTTGLNRYRPRFMKKLLTVYESGWDTSSRFKKTIDILPVDLNCFLYQYEADLYAWTRQERYKKAMRRRKILINDLLWDKETGFYYDYDYSNKRRRPLKSLAGFFPLWCGLASKEQATRAMKHLPEFEYDGGLATTTRPSAALRQWDHPNGWAPLFYLVYQGMRRYGFQDEARRLAVKWLDCNLQVFNKTGKLWEKYNVVKIKIGRRGRYPTQSGFAWTNAVFIRLLRDLE